MRHATAVEPRTVSHADTPPRLRVVDGPAHNAGVRYDSEDYALLNRPIETGRTPAASCGICVRMPANGCSRWDAGAASTCSSRHSS